MAAAKTIEEYVARDTTARRLRRKDSGFDRYRDDPVAFCREVLRFEPWEGQRKVLDAVAKHDAVTNPAGRGVGKSRLDAALALWFAFTRPSSRVILTSTTYKQIQTILWEEIHLILRGITEQGGNALPIDVAKLAATGARTNTGSQIIGIAAEKPEALQGIRGARMLVVTDEASGIDDAFFNVLEGNLSGGGKWILTGNPTRDTGYFRETIRSPRWQCVTLRSIDTPNVMAQRVVVPGLATWDFVEERKRQWGEDSPLYKVHVLGQVCELEEGRLFSVEMIAASTARWAETPAAGRLVIGVDPAGSGQDGDESGFACRRGNRVLKVHARRQLTEDGQLTEILGLIATQRGDSKEKPLVVVDRDGYVGARVYSTLSAYTLHNPDVFDLFGVRGGERARRKPMVYDRWRDEVWFGLVDAFREGLAIPEDVRLTGELAAVRAEAHISGRSKVTAKDELRKILGRSPDRADALSLCVIENTRWVPAPAPPPPDPRFDDREPSARGLDPYAGLDAWR